MKRSVYRIETGMKPGAAGAAGKAARARLHDDLHIDIADAQAIDVYTIDAAIDAAEADRIRTELLTDPIIQTSAVGRSLALDGDFDFVVETGFRPGVTDNVGRSAQEGIEDLLGRPLGEGAGVYFARQYALRGISRAAAERAARGLFANELIEQWAVKSRAELEALDGKPLLGLPIVTERSETAVRTIGLEVDDAALMALSRDMTMALDLREMQAIQAHYRDAQVQAQRAARGLPAMPTDIELEAIAQTWSEHCKHKIFAAEIAYTDAAGNTRTIDGLFKTFVKGTTDAVRPRVDWLVSVFDDNAGIVRFDDEHLFALKVETHNSPSALDPYGGAMTGIVGVNRDILGAGMGCRCIFNTDVFCFATPYFDGAIPERLLHPRRVLRGVHRGVKDGGNESGIPTVNGAIVFHERFLGKPLVFCGTGGLMPRTAAGKPAHEKAARPGDHIVMCGGRIGKDGIHGATFSSEELHEGSPATAVQIGDPITQKKMADFLLEARDLGLFSCITDNGAGGLSSSVGEMARACGGAELHLERAPLKYAGLAPWEIFLSEAQERMTLAVPPASLEAFMALSKRRAVESTAIGHFTDSGWIDCFYEGKRIGGLRMDFLHGGVPRMRLDAKLDPAPARVEVIAEDGDLAADLKAVLGALNVASKESFVRMYDHEVQASSVLKPFQGVDHDGPGDAAVVRPVPGSRRGIAVACGIAPKYSDLDCYAMMANAIDEAVRNLVCVGARFGQIMGLDNFCWPDPVSSEKTPDGPHKLAQLVRTCEALYDVCLAYDIPLISGKDSMKNDYKIGGTKISIPPTVLFTAAALMEDVARAVSMDVKNPGDLVYVLGETREELGGSEYLALRGQIGARVPQVEPKAARAMYEKLGAAMAAGLVASCHDCSDGGLGAALAETAFAGGYGIRADLTVLGLESNVATLFSESASRIVATVPAAQAAAFERALEGSPCRRIGEVTAEERLHLVLRNGQTVDAGLAELKHAWQHPLRW